MTATSLLAALKTGAARLQELRLAVGGDERLAEGRPPGTRGPGAQRGGNLAPAVRPRLAQREARTRLGQVRLGQVASVANMRI